MRKNSSNDIINKKKGAKKNCGKFLEHFEIVVDATSCILHVDTCAENVDLSALLFLMMLGRPFRQFRMAEKVSFFKTVFLGVGIGIVL